jgi:hypothetical protein
MPEQTGRIEESRGQRTGAACQPRRAQTGTDFLTALFQLLEEFTVRYCVLHSWEGLPDSLPSVLDLAVHSGDTEKLSLVFQAMLDLGYQPLRHRNHLGSTYHLLFLWFEDSAPKVLAVNLLGEYVQGRTRLSFGREILLGRQRHGNAYVADAGTEFGFLLSKAVRSKNVSRDTALRLRRLSEELGRARTSEAVSMLFPRKWQSQIVEACASGSIDDLLKIARPLPIRKVFVRHPVRVLRYLVIESASSVRGWLRPTGLCIAVMRPFGVGPSALIDMLGQAFRPIFPKSRTFSFRPQVVPRFGKTPPEALPPRAGLLSLLVLLAFFIDYWMGYLFVVRPALASSTLIFFNRYFQDMLAEPLRFRYGGPDWALKLVSHLVPSPDLVFIVIDAEDEVLMPQTAQRSPSEAKAERKLYLRLTSALSRSTKVWSEDGPDGAMRQASRLVLYQIAAGGDRSTSSHSENPAASSVPALISLDTSKSATRGFVRHGFSNTHRYVVLPSHKAPRWLLPMGAGAGSTSKGLQLYTPYSRVARAMKGLVAATIAGWPNWATAQAWVGSKAALPLERLVSEITGEPHPVFALSIGTPGLFRKLTIQVMRLDGEILGYIKIPLTPEASERLRHEARILSYLSTFNELSPYVPKLLHGGDWGEGYLLFQTGSSNQVGPTEFGALHQEFLQMVWAARRVFKPGNVLLEEVATRWRKVESQMNSLWQSLGAGALAKASSELSGVQIACGIMHGDFAPWNTRIKGGKLFAFDWEWASLEAPNSWDIHHFRVQVTSLLSRTGGSHLLLGQTPGDRASFLLYILNSACQFFEEKVSDGHLGLAWRQKLLIKELS